MATTTNGGKIMSPVGSVWALHGVVIIFGFSGILGKLISLPADQLVFWRVIVGSAGVWLLLAARGRLVRLDRASFRSAALVGILVALHWLTFFGAIKASNVSIALAAMATVPLFVSFIEPIMHKRRFDFRELVLAVAIGVGLAVLIAGAGVGKSASMTPDELAVGLVLGVISALLAAYFSVWNSRLILRADAANLTRVELVSAAAFMVIWTAVTGDLWRPEFWTMGASDLAWLVLLGTVGTALAFLIAMEVMRQLTAFTVAMAVNLEPVYAMGLAVLVFGEEERMGPYFYLGAAIMVGAVLTNGWLKRGARLSPR